MVKSSRGRRLLRACLLLGLGFMALYAFPPSFRYDGPQWAALNRLSVQIPDPPGRGPLPEGGGDLLITGATIVDGTGAPPWGPASILIRGGKIAALFDGDAPPDELGDPPPTLDVGGAFVTAGLMDAHVHMGMAPAGAVRMDSAEDARRLRLFHLKAYLASGVTTIFDPAVDPEVGAFLLRHLAAGHPGPRYVHLGPLVSNAHGYGTEIFSPGMTSASDVEARLDEDVAAGAVGVKMAFESGPLGGGIWTLLPDDLRDAIVAGAAKRGLPLFIHCMVEDACVRAAALHPRALVHVPDTVGEGLMAQLEEDKPFMITTLARWDIYHIPTHPELLDQPLWRLTVPEESRAALFDPVQLRRANVALFGWMFPHVPGPLVTLLGVASSGEVGTKLMARSIEALRDQILETVQALHAHGIPLVLGTDAGNHPVLPNFYHAVLTQREVELLQMAGLTSAEILRSATVEGARMLGLDALQGTVEVGKRADLIVLGADPLADLGAALKALRWTVFDGVAHTPEEWMAL